MLKELKEKIDKILDKFNKNDTDIDLPKSLFTGNSMLRDKIIQEVEDNKNIFLLKFGIDVDNLYWDIWRIDLTKELSLDWDQDYINEYKIFFRIWNPSLELEEFLKESRYLVYNRNYSIKNRKHFFIVKFHSFSIFKKYFSTLLSKI